MFGGRPKLFGSLWETGFVVSLLGALASQRLSFYEPEFFFEPNIDVNGNALPSGSKPIRVKTLRGLKGLLEDRPGLFLGDSRAPYHSLDGVGAVCSAGDILKLVEAGTSVPLAGLVFDEHASFESFVLAYTRLVCEKAIWDSKIFEVFSHQSIIDDLPSHAFKQFPEAAMERALNSRVAETHFFKGETAPVTKPVTKPTVVTESALDVAPVGPAVVIVLAATDFYTRPGELFDNTILKEMVRRCSLRGQPLSRFCSFDSRVVNPKFFTNTLKVVLPTVDPAGSSGMLLGLLDAQAAKIVDPETFLDNETISSSLVPLLENIKRTHTALN